MKIYRYIIVYSFSFATLPSPFCAYLRERKKRIGNISVFLLNYFACLKVKIYVDVG